MIDATANDALDALEACPCCLLGPQQRCLKTPYTHLDNTEIYSDMLRECFNIQLDVASDKCGICEECVVRLRDASHFKRQVQRSQAQLQERLARVLEIIEEEPPVTVNSETADKDQTNDNLSGEELADEMAGSGGAGWGANILDELPVETVMSEGSADNGESDVYWEVTDDDGTSDASSGNVKNAEMETAGEQKASVSVHVYSGTNEDVGEMSGVKHSNTANITQQTPHKCSRCSYIGSSASNLRVHERKHTGEKPYKCNRCSYASAHKSNLVVHERKHTGEKPYKCSHCSFACSTKSYLVVHERKHTGEKLLGHEIKHTGEKKYKCNLCSYATDQKGHLRIHEQKHTGVKPYKCSHCSYASAQNSKLLRHVRVHTGEKPYICSYCSSAYALKSNLLRHERKHTGEKPYKCNLCSYASAHKGNLLVHERKHTGEKPYKCSHCSFACTSASSLLVHERKHTGEKPYKCSHCNHASARKYSLIAHERKHTGEKLDKTEAQSRN